MANRPLGTWFSELLLRGVDRLLREEGNCAPLDLVITLDGAIRAGIEGGDVRWRDVDAVWPWQDAPHVAEVGHARRSAPRIQTANHQLLATHKIARYNDDGDVMTMVLNALLDAHVYADARGGHPVVADAECKPRCR